MAESADILSGDHQTVILPDLHAGCSMADMANLEQVEVCWEALTAVNSGKIVPVTYINSTAAIKAFVGRNGGAVCTSSNARKVMEWALARGEKALFLPDEHLGRNTGYGLGIPLDKMAVWNPAGRKRRAHGQRDCRSADLFVEGPLLRPPAFSPRTRGARAQEPSGHSGDRAPRMLVGSLPGGG